MSEPNEIVKAKVIEVRRRSIIVELQDSSKAIIPAVEIIPDIKPSDDLRKISPVHNGDSIDIVIYDNIKHGEVSEKLASYIRIRNDPWSEVNKWNENTIKTMEVFLVTSKKAIGMISPGIHAQVIWDEIKKLFPPHWQSFATIVPGDKVAGYIAKIDKNERIVTLDIKKLIQSEIKIEEILAPEISKDYRSEITDFPTLTPMIEKNYNLGPLRRVLIVEDHDPTAINIESYLLPYGCNVNIASDEKKAKSIFQDEIEPIDTAIIDIHLYDAYDLTGLDLARWINLEYPSVSIILITADESIFENELMDSFKNIKICDLIYKPFSRNELLQSISLRNRKPSRLIDFVEEKTVEQTSQDLLKISWNEQINGLLKNLRTTLEAEAVVLFSLHPISNQVEIIAKEDPDDFVSGVKPNIERSPIRDVAFDHVEYLTGNATSTYEFPRHRWLQRAYHYHSCIAVPVKVPSELAYALFAFHREKYAFKKNTHQILVSGSASQIASILYALRLEKFHNDNEPYELLGKSYGSMAHDLYNSLTSPPIERLKQLVSDKKSFTSDELADLKNYVQSIESYLNRTAAIVNTFRKVARNIESNEEEVDLINLLDKYIKIFHEHHFILNDKLFVDKSVDNRLSLRLRKELLNQILFNLILNARQQIDRFPLRKNLNNEIIVELKLYNDGKNQWAYILVHDTGPGIHTADFEKVFEIGYSTKENGIGMGLDVCRRIAKKIEKNGKHSEVKIKNSILFIGTTLEIKLPI